MNKLFYNQNVASDRLLPISFILNTEGDQIRGDSGNDLMSTVNYSIIGYSSSGEDSTLFVGMKNIVTSGGTIETVDSLNYSISKGISDINKLEFSIFVTPNNPNDSEIYDPTISSFRVSTTGAILTNPYYLTGDMPLFHSSITFDDSNPDYYDLYYDGQINFLDGTKVINLKELTNLEITLSIDILAN
jgi:hypothetical protein